jgi:LytS/YehU family sensor histidine kinase
VGASVSIAGLMVLGVLPFLRLIIERADRAGPMAAIFASHVAIVLGWSSIYVGYHYLQGIRKAEAEKWRLQLSMREAELRALRSQLNPHFLFNSLNSLRGLIGEDPVRAREAMGGLAAFLRYTIQLSRTSMTTLEQELEATQHYLELEAVRFESRLRYAVEVDERARDHPIPPMLIQTLVENAIKHGISPLPEGGAVRVEARRRSDSLHVRVTNTGRLEERREGLGVGLKNSLERLRLVFGDGVRLELEQTGPDEVRCDVIIPAPSLPPPVAQPEPMESVAP